MNTQTWSIMDRFALVWSICLHQQAIPRDLDEHWLHCWPQQCQRTYPKYNIGKCPQPVLHLLVITQKTVAINLMILRDPGILQNRETRATGPPSVVTLSDMQDQWQMLQIRRPHQGPHKLCEEGHLTVQLGGGLDNENVYANLPYSYHTCCLRGGTWWETFLFPLSCGFEWSARSSNSSAERNGWLRLSGAAG